MQCGAVNGYSVELRWVPLGEWRGAAEGAAVRWGGGSGRRCGVQCGDGVGKLAGEVRCGARCVACICKGAQRRTVHGWGVGLRKGRSVGPCGGAACCCAGAWHAAALELSLRLRWGAACGSAGALRGAA